MIIVSQDKDAILNFDNVITIRTATDIESKKERLVAIDTIDGERYYIAKYATEERAKEVLQEILTTYSNFETLRHSAEREKNILKEILQNRYKYFDLYEMPKE